MQVIRLGWLLVRWILGGLMTVSSFLQLIGLPGDLPTWLTVLNEYWKLLSNKALNIAMLLVGLALLVGFRFRDFCKKWPDDPAS